MTPNIVFIDPSPAVATIIARSLRKRMAAALIEGGGTYPTRALALDELRRRGFSEQVVSNLGEGALRLARRARRQAAASVALGL